MNRFIVLIVVAFIASCQLFSPTEQIDHLVLSGKLGVELRAINENYTRPECYFAKYSIKNIRSDGSTNTANGIIRADNLQNRMMMEFSVPFIGYKLSRMVIKNKRVHINDIYYKKKYNVDLKTFALGGLTKSKIPLPFYIFQDVLFAKLPVKVFKGRAKRKINDRKLIINWKTKYEKYEYLFDSRRLKKITYTSSFLNEKQKIEIFLKGRYKKTSFPRSIRVVSHNTKGKPEQLLLRFGFIQKKSTCLDSHFQEN